jgi:spore germination protein YaaH
MKRLLVILLFPALASAQEPILQKSIHQLDAELHQHDSTTRLEERSKPSPLLPKPGVRTGLSKKVYGWHPYWAATNAYTTYDYSALTHIAYFSYETDTATGGYKTIRGWDTNPIISYAHQRGVKVTLTVTNFGKPQNDALLGDTTKQNTMIATLIGLLTSRSGDGVNFDLESINSSQRSNLVAFMRRACDRIKAALPEAEISMATPAVDWSGTWDFAQLAGICDYLIVMGYDYYWSGSSTSGPVAPLTGENYNVTRTISTYLAASVPPARLLLGVPWYGLDWPVQNANRKSTATGTASSRLYNVAEPMASTYGKAFDAETQVPWFVYTSGTAWRQVWYDDSLSLALKYALTNARSLGGIGIWALSYDGGRSEIWKGIKTAFATTRVNEEAGAAPARFALQQNYPNPFNPGTTIGYSVAAVSSRQSAGSRVRLAVYDLLGREVAVLVDEPQSPGEHTVTFDASGLPTGVYVYRLTTGDQTQSRKLMLMK